MVLRGAKEEVPFYGCRDLPHTKKSAVAQMRTSARIIVMGEFFVDHTWLLQRGLPVHAYYGRDRQSDAQAALCLASDFYAVIAWDGYGALVYAFIESTIAQVTAHCQWFVGGL